MVKIVEIAKQLPISKHLNDVKFDCCGFSAKRLAKLVPDSGEWMVRMLPPGVYSMKGLIEKLKFTGWSNLKYYYGFYCSDSFVNLGRSQLTIHMQRYVLGSSNNSIANKNT